MLRPYIKKLFTLYNREVGGVAKVAKKVKKALDVSAKTRLAAITVVLIISVTRVGVRATSRTVLLVLDLRLTEYPVKPVEQTGC
jgi:hypothetical protein